MVSHPVPCALLPSCPAPQVEALRSKISDMNKNKEAWLEWIGSKQRLLQQVGACPPTPTQLPTPPAPATLPRSFLPSPAPTCSA